MGPGVAVAEVRTAVRACLAGLTAGDLVLVACSGGADSLALAAATAFVAPRLGLRAGAVTVDHGLQAGSNERAAEVAALLSKLGLDPVRSVAVTVPLPGASHRGASQHGAGPAVPGQGSVSQAGASPGPEAAARVARYGALDAAAAAHGAAAVLLGHTLDDQAETVLLGLARGSGGRSLAGMAARRGCYRRPLLAVRRAATAAACAELGLEPWQDPHNSDFRFTRARVRHQALPALEAALGPGVAEALARTAVQLRADAECLDDLAFAESGQLRQGGSDPAGLDVAWLAALPAAIRTRVLRDAAVMAGCPPGALTAGHIGQVDALVTAWHGQRWADLPGGVRARRQAGKVWFSSTGRGEG
jgi:tRNA(Ile)-lysidine synthase